MDMLRSLVNLRSEQDFVLAVAWLVAALHRNIPKPIMTIRGGEGSAKSSLVEILRGLIDPHDPSYCALPSNDRKLRFAAGEAYCQAYDNVSALSLSMSDALCRLVTGGKNQPVIINSLSDIVARPDLADRCLFVDCTPIPDLERRTQRDVMTAFARTRPQILGTLLDGAVHALRTQAQIKPDALPRMADFSAWVAACEPVFWPMGSFNTAYELNRAESVEVLIGSDPVGIAVRSLMADTQLWEGAASDLDVLLRAIPRNVRGPNIGPQSLGSLQIDYTTWRLRF